jgi:hypothetical protein
VDSISRWLRIFEIVGLPPDPLVLAVAPRGTGAIAEALRAAAPAARLTELTIAARDRGLPLTLPEGPFHLALFDHAIDDIVCGAVAAEEGLDVNAEGRLGHPAAARALRAYWRAGDLQQIAAPAVTALVDLCRAALSAHGRLVFAHQVFDSDLRLGQPLEVYADYIPLARKWIAEAGLPLRELRLDGLDPHWWLCLERTG